jgi:alpha-beta hydrolase superfamily lysophospholipase
VTEPETHTLLDGDGVTVYVYRWAPSGPAKAVVHLAHGMGEHARRYDHVADALVDAGYLVYADDHRASGRTGAEGCGLGDLGPRGMIGALESLHDVVTHVRSATGGPVVLVGHSWGSFLAQRLADRWGEELDGLVLSGSTLLAEPYIDLGNPNARFEPATTPYDWLSRDPATVRAYLEDPWCGMEVAFEVTELLNLAGPPADTVPPDLPVLVLNGGDDAVGGFNGGGKALAAAYEELGLGDVTYQGYPGGRHELFNETNRHEVLDELVSWLDGRFAEGAVSA